MKSNRTIALWPDKYHLSDRKLLLLLIIALAIRIIWFFLVFINDPNGFKLADSTGYLALAENIVDVGTYSMSTETPLYPDVFRTPIYPGILAFLYGCGLPFEIILCLQIIASVLIVFYTYQIACQFFSKTYVFVPCLILVFDLPSILFANTYMTETFFAFLVLAGIVALLNYLNSDRYRMIYLSALFFGLATLTRPIGVGLPLFIAFFLFFVHPYFFSQRRIKTIFGFLFVYLLVISIWIVRNQVYHQKPFLSCIGSFNLVYFSAAELLVQEKNISLNEARTQLYEESARLMSVLPNEKPAEFYSKTRAVALKIIAERPLPFLKNMLHAEFRMLFHPMSGYIRQQFDQQWNFSPDYANFQKIALYFQYIQILAYSILSLFGLFQLLRKKHRILLLLISVVMFYFMACAFGPEMEARFRIPIMPIIVLISITGLELLSENKLFRTRVKNQ